VSAISAAAPSNAAIRRAIESSGTQTSIVPSTDCGLTNSSKIQAIVSPSDRPMPIACEEKLAAVGSAHCGAIAVATCRSAAAQRAAGHSAGRRAASDRSGLSSRLQ